MSKISVELPLDKQFRPVSLHRMIWVEQVTRVSVSFRIFIGFKPRTNISQEDWHNSHTLVTMSYLDFYHFCKGLKLEGPDSYLMNGRDLVKFILESPDDYEFEGED